ncbi:alanine racemase [Thalassotalea agarivorans]|uniref:alanine racemase n=1 Tax=Thalassotalea agarivorans TaxID=349064 RepID=UPI001FE04F12|nr:alanine racemase [Thalassotalea agarivorans]
MANIVTATVTIDASALAHNIAQVKQCAPHSKIVTVLKANGYGHGIERIAKMLPEQADMIGVARACEAIQLREAGIKQPILLMEGFFTEQDLAHVVTYDLHTAISTPEQLEMLLSANLSQAINVWLKVDTGMHRLGIDATNFDAAFTQLQQSNNVADDIVVMTHFASADIASGASAQAQLQQFEHLVEGKQTALSLANSAAVVAWPQAHQDWVRPGVMLYGVNPMTTEKSLSPTLRPVMTLQASLISKRLISAGETVGYGDTWTAKQDTYIGVVAVGYGDGYPRHAESGTPVLINDRIVPLVGRVSMDMITIDLGPDSSDNVGDIVTLWGNGLPIEDVAECASTIAYELLCNIASRVKVIER